MIYDTYRKPQNCYLYTPYSSNHSKSTLLGIVSTECVRMVRSSQVEHKYLKQILFFLTKLLNRGFHLEAIDSIFSKFLFSAKAKYVGAENNHKIVGTNPSEISSIVPFKLMFCIGIGRTLKRYENLISKFKIQPMQCSLTSKNLFRRHYERYR